ncbi:MAG: hypothetical protein ACRDDY_02300 [Clostridium sp.]|uniref:hypothetical protein n=1 Tax=Clostridium sp. TaxID=1506 RepID=UPI003EE7B9CE
MENKQVIMCLTLDELMVISEGLDLLWSEFSDNIEVNQMDIQSVIERIDSAIEKIEND